MEECSELSGIIISIRAFLLNEIAFSENYMIDRKDEQRGQHVSVKRSQVTIPEDAGMDVLMAENSAKVTEKQTAALGGYYYENTVEWEQPVALEDADDLLSQLSVLQRYPHHLIVTFFGGRELIIRTNPDGDGYRLVTSQESEKIKMSITIKNLGGTRELI